MIRACLLAIGIFLLILGAQTLVVDRWLIAKSGGAAKPKVSNYYDNQTPFRSASFNNPGAYNGQIVPASGQQRQRVFRTREWMPWSLLAGGTIVVLYAYSLRPSE